MMYDTIIIGKGPAGISAALYLVRSGFSVLVIGKGHGSLEKADKIENYYGFPEPVGGAELVDRGIAQAERLGVTVLTEEVVNIGMEDSFVIKTVTGEYQSKTVLLATGKSRFTMKIPGFEEFRGKGISFCATCDGFFYRNKRLAVIGSGDYAANELHELLVFTRDITLFTNGEKVTTDNFPSSVSVVADKITRFSGTAKITGIETADGTVHSVDGVFVAIGTANAADFAAKVGVEVQGTDIVVDPEYMTNIPGLFAGGDCIGGFLQIAKSVSDGALAAKNMISYLKNL
jgi:thioredoxin reductase (NADPH)